MPVSVLLYSSPSILQMKKRGEKILCFLCRCPIPCEVNFIFFFSIEINNKDTQLWRKERNRKKTKTFTTWTFSWTLHFLGINYLCYYFLPAGDVFFFFYGQILLKRVRWNSSSWSLFWGHPLLCNIRQYFHYISLFFLFISFFICHLIGELKFGVKYETAFPGWFHFLWRGFCRVSNRNMSRKIFDRWRYRINNIQNSTAHTCYFDIFIEYIRSSFYWNIICHLNVLFVWETCTGPWEFFSSLDQYFSKHFDKTIFGSMG